MLCVAVSGVAKGYRGERGRPVSSQKRTAAKQSCNRVAAWWWLALSLFPFLIPVSLLLFLETVGIGVLWACWHRYLSLSLSRTRELKDM